MSEPIGRSRSVVGLGAVFLMVVVSCGMGAGISGEKRPLSLEALYLSIGIPSRCGDAPSWEGKKVIFQGYVDQHNIFDRQHYPQLPYEKFKVTDRNGRSIEVWVNMTDSRPLFERLKKKMKSQVTISGRLAAVMMPVTGKCRLGAKVWIDDSFQIQ